MNARGLLTALLRRPGVRLSLLTVAYLALGVQGGVFVLLFVLPLYAALATFAVIELMREWRHGVRRAVWQEAQGQYYAYRDVRIHVLEDEFHCRWLRVADVRQIYPPLVSDHQLRHAYPGTSQYIGERPRHLYLRDDSITAHLRRVNEPLALRLGTWIERAIWYPASKIRQRLGIRLEASAAPGQE